MKRWTALFASIVMQTCLGMVYAWSTFVPALRREHGVTPARSGLIFGLCIASFTVSMVFGGLLQKRYGPRLIGMAGGILFGAGYASGAYSGGSELGMIIGFGLLAGAGIGFAYVCPLATGVKWFPHRKGLITGLTVAGFGLGGVFFAKGGQQMLDAGLPVLLVLGRIGLTVGAVVIVCSAFLFVPAASRAVATVDLAGLRLRQVFRQRDFRTLFWQMSCGTFGGLLIIGNLKPIGLSNGLTAEAATVAVMLFAIGNAAGRVLWGVWYDRFNAAAIMACMLLLAAGSAIMGLFSNQAAFYTAAVMTAFAFGGCFVLFAARVADVFGTDRISDIYPLVFLGYGIAGLTGPPVGGWMLDRAGTALLPCLAVVALAIAGAAMSPRRVILPALAAESSAVDMDTGV